MLVDRKLVIALKKGDDTAFDKLYHKYVQRLYAFVLKTAKSPELTEDVVHDTFVKIWEKRSELNPEHSFQSFLFTIARNRLLNLIKRSAHEASILEEMFEHVDQEFENSGEQTDYQENTILLDKAIEQLPEHRRAIFTLCQKEGLTYQETANHLDISYSTVNSQMVKVLKSIRKYVYEKEHIALPIGMFLVLRFLL